MYDRSQLLKGVLEGCILKILAEHEDYGYSIVISLNKAGFTSLKEGSVYPVLTRLEKKGLIRSRLVPSNQGPSRKSYSLTTEGIEYFNDFTSSWQTLTELVNSLLTQERGDHYEEKGI